MWSEIRLGGRIMTNKEAKDILKTTKTFFDSLPFENSQEVRDALDVAIEVVSNKEEVEESKKSEKFNKTPFDRVKEYKRYCVIGLNNEIVGEWEYDETFDDKQYECSNYFNDEDFAKQVALHQLLYRKLLKFKLQRDIADKNIGYCFFVNLDKMNILYVDETFIANRNCNGVYFNEHSTAELALKEVVKPFLEEHPDFIWNL